MMKIGKLGKRKAPSGFSSRRFSARSQKTYSSVERKLERAKTYATIFSAIAIPVVLTISGYFIQRQLANEGLRKDYVGIATAVLKEKPEGQEPELRAWAVKILDENAPVPFSKKAREGLLSATVVGISWVPPPEDCRIPPKKRTFIEQFAKVNKGSEKLDARQYLVRLATVVDPMLEAETDVEIMAARLRCMQQWASIIEKSSADFREVLYAPPETKVMKLIDGYFEK